MNRRISKPWFFSILLHVILSLVMLGIALCTWDMRISDLGFTKYISVSAVILLAIQLLTFYKLKVELFDLRYMFIVLSYVFLLGRILVHGFNLSEEYNLFFYRYTFKELYKTSIFCLAFIQLLFLGFLLPNNKKVNISRLSTECRTDKALFYTGLFILIVSFPFELYYKMILLMAQVSANAYVGGGSVGVNGIVQALSRMTTVGVITIISSKVLSKKNVLRLTVIFLLYEISLSIFTGERGFVVLSAITLVICTVNLYRIKIKLPQFILLGVIGYISVALLATIGTIRNSLFTAANFFETFINNLSGSVLAGFLSEFGNTINTVGMAIKYVSESKGLYYGSTLILSFLAVIPGIYRFLPNASLMFNPIDIITAIVPWFYFGGSIALDSYLNFGHIFGLFFGTIYGIIIMSFLKICLGEDKTESNKIFALYYIKYYILLRMVRCGFSEIIRLYIYALVVFYLAYSLTKHRTNNLLVIKHPINSKWKE